MRVIGEIPHDQCKITIFNWNGKYLLKFERGLIEQTYKVSEMDISGEEEIKAMINKPFTEKVLQRFDEMERDLFEAMENLI